MTPFSFDPRNPPPPSGGYFMGASPLRRDENVAPSDWSFDPQGMPSPTGGMLPMGVSPSGPIGPVFNVEMPQESPMRAPQGPSGPPRVAPMAMVGGAVMRPPPFAADIAAAQQEREAALRGQQDAARQWGRDRESIGQNMADAYDQAAAATEAHGMAQRGREVERARLREETISDLQRRHAELEAYKEDPNRFWSSRGAAGQVGAVIAVMLGAAGSRGGPNQVSQMFNRAIDDDIAAQRANYSAKRASLRDRQTLYGMQREKWGDEDTAAMAAKSDALKIAQLQVDKYGESARSIDVKQRAAQISGQLAENIAILHEQIAANNYDRWARMQAMRAAQANPPMRKGIEKDATSISQRYSEAKLPELYQQLNDVDGLLEKYQTGKDARGNPRYRDIPGLSLSAELKNMVPLVGPRLLSAEEAHGQQMVQGIRNAITAMQSGQAVSNQEAERLMKQLEGAKDAKSLQNMSDNLRRVLDAKRNNIAATAPDAAMLLKMRGSQVGDNARKEIQQRDNALQFRQGGR